MLLLLSNLGSVIIIVDHEKSHHQNIDVISPTRATDQAGVAFQFGLSSPCISWVDRLV